MNHSDQKRKKVAILGSGVGAMTTAYELTNDPGWRERFESITVYQLGWRLGGKGASGRQSGTCAIEEHGLHVWLGFYENAFKMIRAAYAELDRPKEAPLSTWDKAFRPHSYVGIDEHIDGEWHPWMFDFPTNDSLPGEGGELPTLWDYVEMLAGWLVEWIHKSKPVYKRTQPNEHHDISHWLKGIVEELELDAGLLANDIDVGLISALGHVIKKMHAGDKYHDAAGLKSLLAILGRIEQWLGRELAKLTGHDIATRRQLLLIDMGTTIMRGLIQARIWEKPDGLDTLDMDFAQWLESNGALEITADLKRNPILRGLYDFVFAYENGEIDKPNFAAGPALRTIFRMCFTYKGAIFWKMQAGMGDTIFAPLYDVLKARGVTFKFFQRVRNLGLSQDKSFVQTISIGRQVTLKDGNYDPLVDCVGLPCWPNKPIYDQIVEGDRLEQDDINLESFWTAWKDVENCDLHYEKDFDIIVFGISLGSIPYLCPELVDHNGRWRTMVDKVGTVRTLALQLWLTLDLKGLGWESYLPITDDSPEQRLPIMDSYVEPLNTWADMSNLLVRECWGGEQVPKSINYFCGPMQGGIDEPSNHAAPAQARAKLDAIVETFLAHDIRALWPKAADGDGLDEKSLVEQFRRVNIDPSERYVMSLAESTQYRLRANESGFANLFLTGDWIRNDFNAGCVEAAVMGGMQCANAILGNPPNQGIVG